MINPLLAKPIIDLVGNVFERIFPDKEQADKAKQEFMFNAATMQQAETKEFHDFVVAYEGSGADVHPYLQILRGSVRPVLTYALAGLYGYGFAQPAEFTAEQMQGLFQLNLISLGFWYGEKALKGLGVNLSGDKK
jgi:holin (3TMs family)